MSETTQETKRLIVYVSEDIHKAVKNIADEDGRKVSNYVAQLLKKVAQEKGYIEMDSKESNKSSKDTKGNKATNTTTSSLVTLSGSEADTTTVEGVDDWC